MLTQTIFERIFGIDKTCLPYPIRICILKRKFHSLGDIHLLMFGVKTSHLRKIGFLQKIYISKLFLLLMSYLLIEKLRYLQNVIDIKEVSNK